MDQDKPKPAEVTSEPQVETPIEETDLDVVTGGLISTGGAGASRDPSCVTAAP